MKILVLHNAEPRREIIRAMLFRSGHRGVECVESLEQAMNTYQQKGPFDVVLIDRYSGVDFLRVVRKENPLQEAVLISASPREVNFPLINELNAAFLKVPFSKEELIEAVESHKHRSVH